MSRTFREDKETTTQRRIFARRFRARWRAALCRIRAGLDAEGPRWRGTCGWLSW